MKKWILALVCTAAAGATAGCIGTWAMREGKLAELEKKGCTLVIGNESEDVIYSISVSYENGGEAKEAVRNQYMKKGQEAYFAVEPAEDLNYRVEIQTGDHSSVEAKLQDDFEYGEQEVYWLTGKDGEYALQKDD